MVGFFCSVGTVALGGEQASKCVVGEVAEASGNSEGCPDEAVDRLSGFDEGAAGVELSQDRRFPLFECPTEPGDFRDGAGRERCDELGTNFSGVFLPCVVNVAEPLGALLGQRDFVVQVPGGELQVQPAWPSLGKLFGAHLQGSPALRDWWEIASAS